MNPMNREEVLDILRTHKPTLVERFGVTEIALFGSFARDEATDGSDVDILVRYDGPATSRSYFGVQFYLEDVLDRKVDLVTHKALRSEFRPYVEREAIDVTISRPTAEHPVDRIAGILDGTEFDIDEYVEEVRGR